MPLDELRRANTRRAKGGRLTPFDLRDGRQRLAKYKKARNLLAVYSTDKPAEVKESRRAEMQKAKQSLGRWLIAYADQLLAAVESKSNEPRFPFPRD